MTSSDKQQAVSLPRRFDLPSHATASAVVFCDNHLLMVHHRRIGAWVPPGGHIESNELPHEAAIREVYEETGVRIVVLSDSVPITDNAEAFFPPQPLCMHVVHAVEKGEEIYHLDIAYLCVPEGWEAVSRNHSVQYGLGSSSGSGSGSDLPSLVLAEDELHSVRWVRIDQLHEISLANNVLEILGVARSKAKWLFPETSALSE